jgi:YedE family putative selenium metabolism protein
MLRNDVSRAQIGIGIALAGLVGVAAALLVWLGNPGNMGICGACFLRDVAGALGLIHGDGSKIFRPEVAGVMFGALAWVGARGKYAARSGSHAVTRFGFGVLMAFAALVFLGCPFRLLQRVGGGDGNAWIGLIGFIAGVRLGMVFEKRGYSVGKTSVVPAAVGLVGPFLIAVLLALFLLGGRLLGPGPGQGGGSPHAPWAAALALATFAGVALSATGFCAVLAARQVFQPRKRMLLGAVALIAGYALFAAAVGRFRIGLDGQPAAHTEVLWNFLAPALLGLCGVLAGGCPVRQMVMAGEGNGDAFVTVAGILIGGALAHDLGIASSGSGTTTAGGVVVVGGVVVAVAYAAATTRRVEGG